MEGTLVLLCRPLIKEEVESTSVKNILQVKPQSVYASRTGDFAVVVGVYIVYYNIWEMCCFPLFSPSLYSFYRMVL